MAKVEQEITRQLRQGVVLRKPPAELHGEVEWDEVYVLVVRQSYNLGYWSLFTCRSRKAGLIRHPNLSHGQTTSGLSMR
uniref:Uncharacterized protein n=1 Tax=Candidatus Kentrum eta TaxID=2126337 RepID=A0A450VQY3_9GAMM|nr:MAG: hypothetical protein BECKH772B_GA0070898_105961 [Candidatus Kentron sp. H]VFK07182.1 MAG: hypothetical protein BECKH772A_GA0070896_107051 [Candidatus Kentron sp. H]